MTNSFSLPTLSNDQALSCGAKLEEFVIEHVIGSGGFGITYMAKDSRLSRRVVIKENLPVQFCWREQSSMTVRPRREGGDDADNFRYTLESFEREATTLASLDHPGIVKVLRSFEANGTAYFVMPFVEGTAFDEVIRNRRERCSDFSEEELGGMLWRVLDALTYLHDRGIYHRDIKPGNILITATGEPVLIDFGAARQCFSERSLTVIESAGYTPFEQLQTRGEIGPWSDLYALAATFYKAITGEKPPKSADRIMDDPVVPLAERTELQGRFSRRFLASIDQAMEPNAKKRFETSAAWKACAWGITTEFHPEPIQNEAAQDESVTMVRRPRVAHSNSPSTSNQAELAAQQKIVESTRTSAGTPLSPVIPSASPSNPTQRKHKANHKLSIALVFAFLLIGIASIAYFFQQTMKPPVGWNPSLAQQEEVDLYACRGVMEAEVEQASRIVSALEKKGHETNDSTSLGSSFGKLLAASIKKHPPAALPLGKCYKNGIGVGKNAEEAVKWFRVAAEAESIEAMRLLGECYRVGVGVSKDSKTAMEWYEKAAGDDDYKLSAKMERLTLPKFEIQNASLSEAVEKIIVTSRDMDVNETEPGRQGVTVIIDDDGSSDISTVSLYQNDYKLSDALLYLSDLYEMTVIIKPYAVLLMPSSDR
jgi:serine/threonine protein kinase